MRLINNNTFKIDKRIYVVFILVVSVAITNALLSTIKIRNNKDTIFAITQYTNPTLESLEEFNLLVTRSSMYITNWVYLPENKNDKSNLVQINRVNYPRIKSRLIGLTKGWKSDGNVEQVQKLFQEYESVIREQEKIMKSLETFDDYQDPMKKFLAEEQLESEIIPGTNKIMVNLRELITIKKEEARQMQDAMLQDNVYLLIIVFTLAIMVIIAVMMAGMYLMKQIFLPLMKVREILLKMSAGELPEVVAENRNSTLSEMNMALRQLRNGLQRTSSFAGEIGKGNFNSSFEPLSEKDVLGSALLEMREKLNQAAENEAIRNWASEGYAKISNVLHQNAEDIQKLSDEILTGLVTYVDAQQGAIYLLNDEEMDDPYIEPVSFYAPGKQLLETKRMAINEGLIGQVIATNRKIFLQQVNDHGLAVESLLTSIPVCDVLILPLFAGGHIIGALEIKSIRPLLPSILTFIERITDPVAANILNLKANLLTRRLLAESQLKTKELAHQDEELRQINNALILQSGKLKQSESELRKQQETLKRVNTELENKALLLEEKNMAIEDAHKALAFKAEQLERSNKYKSDFLANMSHELRTPLNSVLILAKLLSENKAGNMNPKQVEHAKVIHKSGSDLLVIINDILDLSKIEAGKLELHKERTGIDEICRNMEQLFAEVSIEKNINFSFFTGSALPEFVYTDRVRTEQVLKNLLSNAFKFTPANGEVKLSATVIPGNEKFQNEKLRESKQVICFSVSDTGIGIPADKQKLIFDAFNQADSSITRKFGGTGLGLAICRQLSSLLGGEISLSSVEGKGSVFSFYMPCGEEKFVIPVDTERVIHVPENTIPGRNNLQPEVLIFSNDTNAALSWDPILKQYNCNVNYRHLNDEMEITKAPHVIILDATLPDKEYISKVMQLAENEKTRFAHLVCRSVSEYIPAEINKLVKLHTTAPVNAALVTSILAPIPELHALFAGANEEVHFQTSDTVLQMPPAEITAAKHGIVSGKKILIADDDIRNIYSLTNFFEHEGAEVVCAMDGLESIQKLREHTNIDIILMDVMMPGMDGLQAIREIRKMESGSCIPIIAVTAKAMRNDREICIGAGANAYITKPLNLDNLMSMIGQHLHIIK